MAPASGEETEEDGNLAGVGRYGTWRLVGQ